jgi:lipoic acid synthetase
MGEKEIPQRRRPRPEWLMVKLPGGENYNRLKLLVRERNLHTVCQDARCPNMGECWGRGTATLMILGDVCTRRCRFCSVKTGKPSPRDPGEPGRVAAAIKEMGLRYAVITSVDRDDLEDGGASVFAETIRRTAELCPGIRIEVLIPDFRGDALSLGKVVEAGPYVLGHNVETVPRLYAAVRPGSRYVRSLDVLINAKKAEPGLITKSSLMIGLGEEPEEILQVLDDLRRAGVDIVTLGQYLQPTRDNLPVEKFYTPEEFSSYRRYALSLGFRSVASGPLVRSSYLADRQV